MIISTTNSIEGKTIKEYLGIVNTNFVLGINLFSEMKAELSDIFGGTSGSYKKKLNIIYEKAINEIIAKAKEKKADAVIGLSIDFDEISGGAKTMMMVSATGTAVTFWNKNDERYSMYSALEKLYDYKVKGILTEEEYEYEKNYTKALFTERIKTELGYVEEDRKLEEIRIKDEEEQKARALRTSEQILQEKISQFGNDDSDISEETILSASYDDIDYDTSDSTQYIVSRFIRLHRFPEACKFYMDETGLDDISSAVDFCLDVKKQIENVNQDELENLVNKLIVLKKRGFIEQAISEYQKLTISDSITAKDYINQL